MSHIVSPATVFAPITPSDTVDIPGQELCRSVYVGVAGDVSAVRADGTVVLFKNAPAGSELPIRPRRINATATTATDLVALF